MSSGPVTLLAVGDISLGLPDADSFFEPAATVLRQADIVVGQVEHVFTKRGVNTMRGSGTACDPRNMPALRRAGFNVATLAGNHVFDWGPAGIEDTIAGLRELGLHVLGAGMTIDEATRPAVVEEQGVRVGFLDYNCVGLKDTWASRDKAGCAYLDIHTYYELDYACPGGPPVIYTFPARKSMQAMVEAVTALRPSCDILVVVFHKGLVHTPVKLADYEQAICRAAIDAGADLVLSHHAHILKGIEVYRGKAVFHGLGNFVNVVEHLTVDPSKGSDQWARRRKEIFGFEPDPDYPSFYPFHPEAKYTIVAKCVIEDGKRLRVSYLPCLVNRKGQPEVLKRDGRGQEVFDYVQRITAGAGLSGRFRWEGDEVAVLTE